MAQHLNTCSKVVHVAGGKLDTGHLSPDIYATAGVGETQLPSLEKHMNHEYTRECQPPEPPWLKDMPIWLRALSEIPLSHMM
jgi:hypothetical protein